MCKPGPVVAISSLEQGDASCSTCPPIAIMPLHQVLSIGVKPLSCYKIQYLHIVGWACNSVQKCDYGLFLPSKQSFTHILSIMAALTCYSQCELFAGLDHKLVLNTYLLSLVLRGVIHSNLAFMQQLKIHGLMGPVGEAIEQTGAAPSVSLKYSVHIINCILCAYASVNHL